MARREATPPKPYYTIKHEHEKSLKAFEQASMMLYTAVTTALSMSEHIKDPQARKLLDTLREHADNYRSATQES